MSRTSRPRGRGIRLGKQNRNETDTTTDEIRRSVIPVTASKTTLTDIYGVGLIVAATVLGDVVDVSRFANRHFASYNGTAPIEVSSDPHKIYRLSRRWNRRLNHAIHMAAVTQISHRANDGRAYYERKVAEGKTGKEALRSLKRRISDAIYRQLLIDAQRAQDRTNVGSGGQIGNDSKASVTDSHPAGRLFGKATPEPDTTLRPAAIDVRSDKKRPASRSIKKAS